MPKSEIFSCNDISWDEVEILFADMAGQVSPDSPSRSRITQLDLAIVQDHTQTCDNCRQKLLDIVRKFPPKTP